MALFRKIFFKKPPDGLFEISDRVYVFDYCFTTDVVEDENYKAYIGGIVSQLRAYFPEGSFMVFNFREGENQSQIANILSEHEMTVMDYPRQYEGCPLLTMEVIHHFLRSCESWLLLGPHNVLLMHCERGGWPVLAFMLAGLLIYRKQYAPEQKTLDMIHKQAPLELLHLFSPLNPLPSQLRYLKYISRRNLGSEWPPRDRELTMDCVILRSIPNIDRKGGCRPILRIYGQDRLLASDHSPKVLFSMPKKSKGVRHYKQVDCGLIKIDINCHIKGDVVLECISLDDDLEREAMMFRVMFNTAFIRSNILILNHDEIDTLWDAKDHFPKEFRAEAIFSELDAPISVAAINTPSIVAKEELPRDAFAKVQEIFSNVNWLDPKPDLGPNFREQIVTPTHLKDKLHFVLDQEAESWSPEALYPSDLEENPKSQKLKKQGFFAVSPLHADVDQDKVDPEQTPASAVDLSTLQEPEVMGSSDTYEKNSERSATIELENQKATVQLDIKEMPSFKLEKSELLEPSNSKKVDRKQTSLVSHSEIKDSMSTGDANLITENIQPPQRTSSGSLEEPIPEKFSDKPKLQLSRSISSPTSVPVEKQLKPSSGTSENTFSTKMKTQLEGLLPALQQPTTSKIITPWLSHSSHSSPTQRSNSSPGSPLSVSRYCGASPTLGITAVLDDHTTHKGEKPIQSTAESSPSTTSVASVPDMTRQSRPVHSITHSPLLAPSTPPPPPSSQQHSDASVAAKLSPKVSLKHSASPLPPLPPPKLSPPPLPPPPSMSKSGNLLEDHCGETHVQAKTASSALTGGKMLSNPSASPPPPPPPPPPSISSPPPYKLSSLSKPPSPPPPPLPENSRAVGRTNSSLSFPKQGTTISPPPPPLPPKASGLVSNTSSVVPPPPPPPRISITSPSTATSPPCPPVPPPLSGKGILKGSPQPPAVPGSNGPIPPAPGPPLSAKGRGLTRSLAKNPNQSKRTTLKPYHWLKLNRVMQGSLWADAQKSGEASKAPEFDMSELENLFAAAAPKSENRNSGGKSNRGALGPKSDKVQLIELRRAYNCEIMLSKVKIPLPDLMNSVLALDDSGLDIDQVENLIKFCPTKEEMELLKGYTGDKENLGKCEQFFLELMKVPRVESKLRVFCFKMQFDSQVSDLRKNLNIVNSASEEVRSSEKLRRIMHTILQLGNALNQGTARGSAVGFRLDSLLKLTDTRARNNKMTLMHYLCKVLAEKLPELLDFPKDIRSLEAAAKIQLKILAEEMQAISKGLEKVAQELTASENDGHVSEIFCKLLKQFLSFAEGEVKSLASLYCYVGRNADALAMYFGEDPAKCPFEQVVSTLLNFLRMFVRAHEENCKQMELEKKKAHKEAEKEKLKMNSPDRVATKIDAEQTASCDPWIRSVTY